MKKANKTERVRGYETAPYSPGWIKRRVPAEYADDALKRIVVFYVINTPCTDLSSSGLSLTEYGWHRDVWRNNLLKTRLFSVANLERGRTFLPVKTADSMKSACDQIGMKKGFQQDRNQEKIVFYKPGRYCEFLAVFYHIRNALAHGRLAMYPIEGQRDIMFALEDGVKRNGEFQVRSRMLLKKSTLLTWIDIIERKVTE